MLEFELWWLLVIPLFFGLGWLAARIDMRAVILSARKLPTDYFKGLSALVDGDSAEASRRLTEVARQEPDVLELQVSVGKLYRRRGENDLAIRLHQQLLASADLPEQHRDLIQLELAEDFQRAGLVDRAEEILLPLSQRAGVADRARSRCWTFSSRNVTGRGPSRLPANCATTLPTTSANWRNSTASWPRPP